MPRTPTTTPGAPPVRGLRTVLAGCVLVSLAVVPPRAAGQPPAPTVAPAAPSDEAQPFSSCEVVARANSEVILACELEWQVRLMFEKRMGAEAAKQAVSEPLFQQARQELMKGLTISRIEIALLYSDFRSNAPQADLNAIKRQLEEPFEKTEVPRLMESVGVKERADLEPRLVDLGTSLSERRDDFYRTMIARSWMTQSAKVNREITHEQMLEFYHAHASDYARPDRVRWEELMVRFDKHPSKGAAYAALAALGNEAHAAVQGAVSDSPAFAAIAPGRSDGFTAAEGGVYDWTSRGALAADSVNAALFTLAPGALSDILEGPVGFHIVRVLQRQEAGPTPFQDVQAEIRKGLEEERFQKAINAKLTDLKKSARLWTVFTGDIGYAELAKLQSPQQR